MDESRSTCAQAALARVDERYRAVGVDDIVARDGGHSFHQGAHVGWAWGHDELGRVFLDFLIEHRMFGINAARYYSDGTRQVIDVPESIRLMSKDPVGDAELERRSVERNQRAYEDLRRRGLLPEAGHNLISQEIQEYLATGGKVDEPADGG